MEKTIVVSGGFDPVHIGHINLLKEAKKLGDKLIVILNNDYWVNKKKEYVFLHETERLQILNSIEYVDEVILSKHTNESQDMSVCNELSNIDFDIFANGGDRFKENTPEVELCKKLGKEIVFGVGNDGKSQSSSALVNNAIKNVINIKNPGKYVKRPWGEYETLYFDGKYWLKTIQVNSGHRLSLQKHFFRDESWIMKKGKALITKNNDVFIAEPPYLVNIKREEIHRIEAITDLEFIEIAIGELDENDIIRLEDDYARK